MLQAYKVILALDKHLASLRARKNLADNFETENGFVNGVASAIRDASVKLAQQQESDPASLLSLFIPTHITEEEAEQI
jgi:hypothetical protein